MDDGSNTPSTFVLLPTLKTLICVRCLLDLRMKVAKFHRLHCKARRVSGRIVNGEQRDASEKHVTADT